MKTLAQESNTALGTVSNVKSFLLARDWIDKSTTEFRLQNIRELFYTWAKDYHQKEARKITVLFFGYGSGDRTISR